VRRTSLFLMALTLLGLVFTASSQAAERTIYIENLARDAREEHLKFFFSPFGKVLGAYVPLTREEDMNKGYGYIAMEEENANKAVEMLNSRTLLGQPLKMYLFTGDIGDRMKRY